MPSHPIDARPSVWRLTRSDDRVIAGVCSALARRWDVDPLLARCLAVLLALSGGFGVVLYLAGWAFLPDARSASFMSQRFPTTDAWSDRRRTVVVLVAALLAPIALSPVAPLGLGPVVVLALLVWLSRSAHRPGRRRRIVTAVVLVGLVAAAGAAASIWPTVDRAATTTWTTHSDIPPRGLRLVGNDATLDLGRLDLTEDTRTSVSVVGGDLRIVVPQDCTLVLDYSLQGGDLVGPDGTRVAEGMSRGRWSSPGSSSTGSRRTLTVELHATGGDVTLVQP